VSSPLMANSRSSLVLGLGKMWSMVPSTRYGRRIPLLLIVLRVSRASEFFMKSLGQYCQMIRSDDRGKSSQREIRLKGPVAGHAIGEDGSGEGAAQQKVVGPVAWA
jgi:hypothetical protein